MGDTNRKYITLPSELNYGDIERVHNTNDWEGEDYSHVKERYAENLGKIEKFATQVSEWKTIDTAPKDGTKIVVGHPKWRVMPIAYWGENPCNPVENDEGEEFYLYGWLIDDDHFCQGVSDGFLGWNEDIEDGNMPTHWAEIPPTNSKEGI